MTQALLQRKASAVSRAGLETTSRFTMRTEGEGASDGYTLSGLAAVFNTPTIIDSWEGHFREILAPGSFRRSLRELEPVMQFDHGSHPAIGSLPIGRYTKTAEEGGGVAVEGRLFKAPLFEPVREGIAAQAIRGMSFRFEVLRDKWVNSEGKTLRNPEDILRAIYETDPDADEAELVTRTVQELRAPEMGPVVFPQYTETTVDLRSRAIVIDLGGTRAAQISELSRAQERLAEMIKQLDAKELAPAAQRVERSAPAETPETHPADNASSEETEAAQPDEHPAVEDATAAQPEEHPAETAPDTFSEIRERMHARMAQIRKEDQL